MTHNPIIAKSEIRLGLADLDQVTLTVSSQAVFDRAESLIGGDAVWQARKKAEARELLALAQIAPRMTVTYLDLQESLRAVVQLFMPVAVRNGPDAPLEIADFAQLGLTYREDAMRSALPGAAFIQVLMPNNCWNANISAGVIQALCLGTSMPVGIRCKDLILLAYGALSMQSVQMDALHPAGVMNAAAASWWQQNLERIPLTAAPFLSDYKNS